MQTASRSLPTAAPGTSASTATGGIWTLVARYGEYVLGGALAVGIIVTIWAALLYAPTDAIQGDAQRIFYVHVPMAWVAYLAFFIVFLSSILYLWRKSEQWDWLARASAELGTVFTTLVLITGSLWGRPIWGTWWTWWDARLTTTFILWFIYVGYLLLRSYTGRSAGGARAAAVLGIIGFVDVPIVHLSVTWWQRLHPAPVVLNGGQPNLPPQMLTALMISLATFTMLYAFLLLQVYRLQKYQSTTQQLRAQVELE